MLIRVLLLSVPSRAHWHKGVSFSWVSFQSLGWPWYVCLQTHYLLHSHFNFKGTLKTVSCKTHGCSFPFLSLFIHRVSSLWDSFCSLKNIFSVGLPYILILPDITGISKEELTLGGGISERWRFWGVFVKIKIESLTTWGACLLVFIFRNMATLFSTHLSSIKALEAAYKISENLLNSKSSSAMMSWEPNCWTNMGTVCGAFLTENLFQVFITRNYEHSDVLGISS